MKRGSENQFRKSPAISPTVLAEEAFLKAKWNKRIFS
jgi:hypothetical protein